MKRFSLLFVILFSLSFFTPIQSQTNYSSFIQQSIKEGAGFAWGVGLDKDMKEFEWFAFFNSDGYYQLKLSRKLKPAEVESAVECTLECIGNWIGVGGLDEFSQKGQIKQSKKYNKILSEKVFKKMRVVEYF